MMHCRCAPACTCRFAAQLADNRLLRASLAAFAKAGGVVYAECGGLLYLSRSIQPQPDQAAFPMGTCCWLGAVWQACRLVSVSGCCQASQLLLADQQLTLALCTLGCSCCSGRVSLQDGGQRPQAEHGVCGGGDPRGLPPLPGGCPRAWPGAPPLRNCAGALWAVGVGMRCCTLLRLG